MDALGSKDGKVEKSTMSEPRISVVMAVYQGERFLAEAIESILSQTEESFEFIIVDDAGNDNSVAIIEEYQSRDPRIVLIRNQENLGLGGSLRVGVNAARGEFIARMDCDDVSPVDRFALQLAYLDQHPEIAILGGNHRMIDESGHDLGPFDYPQSPVVIRWNMLLGNGLIVSNGATMMRRDFLLRLGNYADLRAAQDYELWSRTFSMEPLPIANLEENVLYYRQHSTTITKTSRSYQEQVAVGVRKAQIEGLLNKSIDQDVVLAYRHPGNYEKIDKILAEWISIYAAFFKRFSASGDEIAEINREFLQRLGRYIYFNPFTKDKNGRVPFYRVRKMIPPKMCKALLDNKRGKTRHEEVLVEL